MSLSRSLIRVIRLAVLRVLLLGRIPPVVGLLINGGPGLLRIPWCRMMIRPGMARLLRRRVPRGVGHIVRSLFLVARCTLFLIKEMLSKACLALLRID